MQEGAGKPSMRLRSLGWWYWLWTALPLAAWLIAGMPVALAGAAGLTALQAMHFALREGRFTAFPVQVRLAYLALLLAGQADALGFVHWLQLAGTTAMLTVDYCPLARIVSLAPWNRHEPLTLAVLRRTALTPPGRWHHAGSAAR